MPGLPGVLARWRTPRGLLTVRGVSSSGSAKDRVAFAVAAPRLQSQGSPVSRRRALPAPDRRNN
ncbi:MAG: hypothetical protein MZW92_64995 [Comamonadaceae bacterium]|nr:hypothetical protein [Comamonadaceae bacterium]